MTARNNRHFVKTNTDPDRYSVMEALLHDEWRWLIGNTVRQRVGK
jgi:hypothetical protein